MMCSLQPGSTFVFGAIIVLSAAALAAIWWLPRRQSRRWAIEGKELADLENSARSTVVQIVGGLALLPTFAATWAQITDTRTASNKTLGIAADQQVTERFTRAVEQLASAQVEIRIGGIYGLEGVARESAARRSAIAQILMSYLHQHHRKSDQTRRAVPAVTSITTRLESSACRP